MAVATEEPMLSRLDRVDNILRQLEEIRCNKSPKSSSASTPSSGTFTSEGQASSLDFSPRSMANHCRPIDDVIVETELKGTLIERIVHVEDLLLKLEEVLEAEKEIEEEHSPEKKTQKKGLRQLAKSILKKGKGKHKNKD